MKKTNKEERNRPDRLVNELTEKNVERENFNE